MAVDVVVVGSSNMDLISYVPSLPKPGETLMGRDFKQGFGGKGANQCVMAARLGVSTAMVSKVGDDVFGRETIANYRKNHVDVSHVTVTSDAPTGVAPIAVDDAGQNSIIVVPGANYHLTEDDVNAAEGIISTAKVLICQNEINMAATLAALRLAQKHGVTSILNLAPASEPPAAALTLPTIFCANETEAACVTGLSVVSRDDATKAAEALLARGCQSVLLTLGEQGSLYATRGHGMVFSSSQKVRAVDTSGAGDAYIGGLAYALVQQADKPMAAKMDFAGRVAAKSVTRHGTQASYPTLSELDL